MLNWKSWIEPSDPPPSRNVDVCAVLGQISMATTYVVVKFSSTRYTCNVVKLC